jgi:hypothetical protein
MLHICSPLRLFPWQAGSIYLICNVLQQRLGCLHPGEAIGKLESDDWLVDQSLAKGLSNASKTHELSVCINQQRSLGPDERLLEEVARRADRGAAHDPTLVCEG